jgi:hypothetical protein
MFNEGVVAEIRASYQNRANPSRGSILSVVGLSSHDAGGVAERALTPRRRRGP